jgi:hypothetical protein
VPDEENRLRLKLEQDTVGVAKTGAILALEPWSKRPGKTRSESKKIQETIEQSAKIVDLAAGIIGTEDSIEQNEAVPENVQEKVNEPDLEIQELNTKNEQVLEHTQCGEALIALEDLPEIPTVIENNGSNEGEGKRKLKVADADLLAFHASVGHPKTKNMHELIMSYYPKLRVTEEQCKRVVKYCMACLAFPGSYQKYVIGNTSIPVCTLPNVTIMADNCKFFDKSACPHGYTHATGIVDVFSEFVQFFPSKGETSKELIRIMSEWSNSYGHPINIYMDQNKAFLSKAFNEWSKESGIGLKTSDKWLHSGISLAENIVKVVKNHIKQEFFSDSEFLNGELECWCVKVRKSSSVSNT